MRQSLMGTFPRLRVLDLHGNATKRSNRPMVRGQECLRHSARRRDLPCHARWLKPLAVEHADLWGTREAKYAWLAKHSVGNTEFSPTHPDSPYYFFEPQNTDCRAEYDKAGKSMRRCRSTVRASSPHGTISSWTSTRRRLLERIGDFANLKPSDAEIRTSLFRTAVVGRMRWDSRGWKVPKRDRPVVERQEWRDRVRVRSYRPFDQRSVYCGRMSGWLIGRGQK